MRAHREHHPSFSPKPEVFEERNLAESFLEKAQKGQMSTAEMMAFFQNNNEPEQAETTKKIVAIFEKMQENPNLIPNSEQLKKWGAVLLAFHVRLKLERKLPLFQQQNLSTPPKTPENHSPSEAEHQKLCQENEEILKNTLSSLVLEEWENFVQKKEEIGMILSSEYLNKKLNEQQKTQNREYFLTLQDPKNLMQEILDTEKHNGFKGCQVGVDADLRVFVVSERHLGDTTQEFFRAQEKGETKPVSLTKFTLKTRDILVAALRNGFIKNWKLEGEWAIYSPEEKKY